MTPGPDALAACVGPLLSALGWRGNQTALAVVFPPGAAVNSLRQLTEGFENLGFAGTTTRVKPGHAAAGLAPSLIRTPTGEWLCVTQRTATAFTIFDAQTGETATVEAEVALTRFKKGHCTVFAPATPRQESKVGPYWVQDFVSAHRDALGLALVFSFVLAFFGIVSPQFIGLLYQEITSMSSTSGLVALGWGALLFACGEVAFLTLRQLLLNSVKGRLTEALGREVLRRILTFPLSLSMNAGSASQAARIREFEGLADLFSKPVIRSLLDLPFMTVLIVALGMMGGVMVLVPLVAIVAFALMAVFAYPVLKKVEQDAAEDAGQVQSKLDSMLEQSAVLRLLGIETHWKGNLEAAERWALPSQLRKSQLTANYGFISAALVSVSGVAAVLIGVSEVLAGRLPAGSLMASMMLIWRILDPFRSLFVLLGAIQGAVQAGRRLQKFMALEGEQHPDPHRPGLTYSPSVRVDSVYYKYPGANRFALGNVSFSVAARSALAVSGGPGSGKSTLALALLGLVEGASGRILVGDQSIRQFNSISYRRTVGSLPVQVPLLPLSVRDNLRLAQPGATDAEMERALDEAGLLATVEAMEGGLDARLSPQPWNGRRDFARCLGLARLFLRGSELWVLDEPEQGLEPESRERFLEALRVRQGKVTLLLLTNDSDFSALATAKGRLEQGRYVQEGS